MIIKQFLLTSNPFIQAYVESDWIGKAIFLFLIALSVITWSLLLYKGWMTNKSLKNGTQFKELFSSKRKTPLQIDIQKETLNPFLSLYWTLKKYTLEILHKNQYAESLQHREGVSMLSQADIKLVETQIESTRQKERRNLEKYLFVLATIYTLAPLLGLLGTVWGILTTFSHMQTTAGTNQMVLGGLSLALTTTVLGLIDAIPALIGYNYLKNRIREMDGDLATFATDILSAVELQYRQIDL